MEQDE